MHYLMLLEKNVFLFQTLLQTQILINQKYNKLYLPGILFTDADLMENPVLVSALSVTNFTSSALVLDMMFSGIVEPQSFFSSLFVSTLSPS